MRTLILILGLIIPILGLSQDGDDRSEEEIFMQCKYESQLARGLVSVVWFVQQAYDIQVRPEEMAEYINRFYRQDDPAEQIAHAEAGQVLVWIWQHQPSNMFEAETQYFSECMELNSSPEEDGISL